MMTEQHVAGKTPLVSVVMPNFNCMSYLPKALKSISLQQIKDIEVLVVDDGSTDGGLEWLHRRSLTDSTLRVFETHRAGPAAARNLAIRESKGRYIAFLDSDDAWLPGKLQSQLDFHQANPEVLFSFTNYRQIDESDVLLGDGYSVWENFREEAAKIKGYRSMPNPLPALFIENPVGTSTVLVRRDALSASGLFDELLPSAEDLDLWLRLAQRGAIAFTDEVTTHYLLRSGSESTRFARRMKALELINERFLEAAVAEQSNVRALVKARFACAQAQQHRAEQRYRTALKRHAQAFLYAPSKQNFKAMVVDLVKSVTH